MFAALSWPKQPEMVIRLAEPRTAAERSSLFDLEGERVLVETAVRLIRLLGGDHGYEISQLLDTIRRIAESEV